MSCGVRLTNCVYGGRKGKSNHYNKFPWPFFFYSDAEPVREHLPHIALRIEDLNI